MKVRNQPKLRRVKKLSRPLGIWERVLFYCKPANQQTTTIFAFILWEEQRLNRFWSEKCAEIILSLWAAKKVSSILLLKQTWWCEDITASPCEHDHDALSPRCVQNTWTLSKFIIWSIHTIILGNCTCTGDIHYYTGSFYMIKTRLYRGVDEA
jgi:hypothetical protein